MSEPESVDAGIASVGVVDVNPVGRDALMALLTAGDLNCRGAASIVDLWSLPGSDQIGCIVLSVTQIDRYTLELLDELQSDRGGTPLIVYSVECHVATVVSAMKRGASDVIQNPQGNASLPQSVRDALRRKHLSGEAQTAQDATVQRIASLTPREREVLDLLVAGQSVKEIALQLGTTDNTVRKQRGSILRKMGVSDTANLIRLVLNSPDRLSASN